MTRSGQRRWRRTVVGVAAAAALAVGVAGPCALPAAASPLFASATTPGRPAGLGVAQCFAFCASPARTDGNGTSGRPLTLQAIAAGPSGAYLTYSFSVFAGLHPASGATPLFTETTSAATGDLALLNVGQELSDGAYAYRVQAADSVGSSKWSRLFAFTVDTVAPAAPTEDPASSHTFTVGHPGTIILSDGSADTYAYEYSWSAGVPALPSHTRCATTRQSISAPTGEGYPAYLRCAAGARTTLTPIAPPDAGDEFYVAALDASGNASGVEVLDSSSGEDPAAGQPAHSWTVPACRKVGASLPDTGTAADDPLSLEPPTAPACRADKADGDPYDQFQLTGTALSFHAAQSQAAVGSAAAIDPGSGFSVGAWIYPAAAGAADEDFLSEDPGAGGGVSDFALRLSASGTWEMTLPLAGVEATVTDPYSAQPQSWQFIAGVWDPGNDEVRLYVDGQLVGVRDLTAVPDWGLGPVVEGRSFDAAAGGPSRYASGQITSSFVSDGTMDQTQVQQRMSSTLH